MSPRAPRLGHEVDTNNVCDNEDKLLLQSQSAYMHITLELVNLRALKDSLIGFKSGE
jgi:hypothetical protein